MAFDANDAVNIPKGPGGPKTEQGKAKSSRNAIRTGLYAARDFMREGEEEEYAQSLIKLMDELTPEGTLEETFATEIMGATWRLRRCRLVEEAFGMVEDLDFDPMMDERTEKQQKSVDRAQRNRTSSSAAASANWPNSRKQDSCASKARITLSPLPDRHPHPPVRPPVSTPSWPSPTNNSHNVIANRG